MRVMDGTNLGSIPAGAGKTQSGMTHRVGHRVYPRGCGENSRIRFFPYSWMGLSPRVRGKLHSTQRSRLFSGSIPAGAGKTRSASRPADSLTVYPRGCGENPLRRVAFRLFTGLSPRVRGKRRTPARSRPWFGSIPAGAGKTYVIIPIIIAIPVYPRGCGENICACLHCFPYQGLSPRVRGKLQPPLASFIVWGSIPAGAGKTAKPANFNLGLWVYPRGCGENKTVSDALTRYVGLSPRVRGKQASVHETIDNIRSIPAGAGKT